MNEYVSNNHWQNLHVQGHGFETPKPVIRSTFPFLHSDGRGEVDQVYNRRLTHLENVRQISTKEANFLAIALSQKIEVKLTQKLTTGEYDEFRDIIMAAHKRASKRALHPMLVSAWMSSLTSTRFEPETPHAWTKLEKFVDFLLSVNLKDQLTANEREKLVKALKSTAAHHNWLQDKINDIIDRIAEEE